MRQYWQVSMGGLAALGLLAGACNPVELKYEIKPTELNLGVWGPATYDGMSGDGDSGQMPFSVHNQSSRWPLLASVIGVDGVGPGLVFTTTVGEVVSELYVPPGGAGDIWVAPVPSSLWGGIDGSYALDVRLQVQTLKTDISENSVVETDVAIVSVSISLDCDQDDDGFVAIDCGGLDCDDYVSSINPEAPEVCDEVDNNCDGAIDMGYGLDDGLTWYIDGDGDGYGDESGTRTTESCEAPSGYVTNMTDCDDGDGSINPEEDEVCDGVDNDCDGTADGQWAEDATTWYADNDDDAFPSQFEVVYSCEQPSGYLPEPSDLTRWDCDDDNPDVNPLVAEVCFNGIDDDCNGYADTSDIACFLEDTGG